MIFCILMYLILYKYVHAHKKVEPLYTSASGHLLNKVARSRFLVSEERIFLLWSQDVFSRNSIVLVMLILAAVLTVITSQYYCK